MSRAVVTAAKQPLRGLIKLPGDKSISHRRALLSLFTDDTVHLSNFATGEDCLTTLKCVRKLGKSVAQNAASVEISGPTECQSAELDCGNSGTTARLLFGILAGREGEWTLSGDVSLSRRPMERVAVPLRKMGAHIELTDGHLPARIIGRKLEGIDYESPVPSAQVKSAVLLAGLNARGVTRYREPVLTRDHTERLLGLHLDYVDWITVDPEKVNVTSAKLNGRIPGDPSTASFWIAAALMIPGSRLELPDVLANFLRLGMIKLLREHGGDIHLTHVHDASGEGAADIAVASSSISSFVVRQPDTAALIDELPVLAVLATQLRGKSEFREAGELRVKESDRLKLVTENLRRMSVRVEEWKDGFAVAGPVELQGAVIETAGDHRIAMAFAVAGLAATGQTTIQDAESVAVSYPEFWNELSTLAPESVVLA